MSDTDDRDYDATLILTAPHEITDEALETHADEVLECVLNDAASVALGAAISVNFKTRSIELDFTVLADTFPEAQSQVTDVARLVEEHLSRDLIEARSETSRVLVPAG